VTVFASVEPAKAQACGTALVVSPGETRDAFDAIARSHVRPSFV
jgi:hypothetical protein